MFLSYLITLMCAISVSGHACCQQAKKQWSWKAALSSTYTSTQYSPTNHHKGLSLDHSHVSINGPLGKFLEAVSTLSFHTKRDKNKKISMGHDLEALYFKTVETPVNGLGGRFASAISPDNEMSCCGATFIKRPLLYRALLGGHFIEDGAHADYIIHQDNINTFSVMTEAFHGKKFMSHSNKPLGLFVVGTRYKRHMGLSHQLLISVSQLLNTLYNQKAPGPLESVGCCQASTYTGKHMTMGTMNFKSTINERVSHKLSSEVAHVSTLSSKLGRHNHHLSYNIGSVFSVKELIPGTLEFGLRYDYLRGIQHCPCSGPYLTKTTERTALIGWHPTHQHALRFEATEQIAKYQKKGHIFQIKYTFLINGLLE